jgi:tetratricopeptide (TPR) repeat protein
MRIDEMAGPAGAAELHSGTIEFALERVLGSTAFRRASGLRRFLEYVVRETLAGRGDRLKEYTIGVEVCRRGADFDPRIDTIVRVAAIKLRQRLNAYYRTEGATDPVLISIPKGSYRAVFRIHDDAPPPILDDPEAIYWQASALFYQFTPQTLNRARRLLMLGVARWPDHPRLHSLLAQVIAGATCSYMECVDPEEGVPLMQWAARRALTLDPDRVEAHVFANLTDLRRNDKTALLALASRAVSDAPQDFGVRPWAAAILLSAGNPSEALMQMRSAVRQQPGRLYYRTFTAQALFSAGRIDEAMRHLRDILEFEPDDYSANYWLSRALGAKRCYDEARVVATRAYTVASTAKALDNLGQMEAASGNTAAVKEILAALDQKRAENEYVPRAGLATIHMALGQFDVAAVEAEAAAHDGEFRLAWTKLDPLWNKLRGKVAGV